MSYFSPNRTQTGIIGSKTGNKGRSNLRFGLCEIDLGQIEETIMSINKTKVVHKPKSVTVTMSIENYDALLKGHNDLLSAIETLGDIHDLYISDVRNIEDLRFRLFSGLGFAHQKSSDGKSSLYYASAVKDNDTRAWRSK